MLSTLRELVGYMVYLETLSVLVPFSILWQHQHSDLFTVIIMVARCVRGFAGEWAGNSHV